MFYRLLDIFFTVFHTTLIIFNLLGWLWKRSRKYNLVILLLTGSSWLLLGLIVGTPGYCPLTDWHFKVLYRLGETGLPSSYIKYLTDCISGSDINQMMVDRLTLIVFLAILVLSVFLNIKDYLKGR